MFTTCPKCSLKLVVTAADLRVAQGYVRCGRCSNVFNALAGLSDEQQAVLAREPAAAAPREVSEPSGPSASARESREAPATASASAPEPEPAPADTEEPIPDEALEFDPTTTDVSEVFVEPADDDPTGTFESIVLGSDELPDGSESDRLESSETHEFEIDLEALVAIDLTRQAAQVAAQKAPASAQPGPAEPSAAEPASPQRASQAAQPASQSLAGPKAGPKAASPEPVSPDRGPSRPIARETHRAADARVGPAPRPPPSEFRPELRASHEPLGESLAAELGPVPIERREPGESEVGESEVGERTHIDRALRIGSAALALLLLLQIVNHERTQLAGVSWLSGPLTAVYSAFGVALAPPWNVHAYEVRQLGAVAGPRNPGALTVRASVKNTAAREQPLPLLRVTMQDRFGNRIAARDVPPSAYLPVAGSKPTGLGAGQRVDAEIAFADPGPNAVGFEIDACLKLASGHVACANDAGSVR